MLLAAWAVLGLVSVQAGTGCTTAGHVIGSTEYVLNSSSDCIFLLCYVLHPAQYSASVVMTVGSVVPADPNTVADQPDQRYKELDDSEFDQDSSNCRSWHLV